MNSFTQSQETAVREHGKNLIVVAGAGSGKTFVLVERYLALLDANRDWPLNALVAITFTKKAAQEMRDRVRQALEKRYRSGADHTERDLWAASMAAMDSARIDTIHGLCASILRANAAEAGVDPEFEVLDEVDARLLLDDVVEDVLQAVVAEDDPAVRLLAEYEVNTIERTLVDLIAADIGEMPDNFLEHWQQQWKNFAARSIETLQLESYPRIVTHWNPESDWPRGGDTLYAIWERCWLHFDQLNRNTPYEAQGLDLCLDALRGFASDIKINVGSAGAWGGKERLQELKAELKAIREAAKVALETIGEPPGELDGKAAELLPLWASLIRRAQAMYWQAKQKDSLLDFDDLERLTCQLLADHPAVRQRYQANEFKHILVDEFQDTNRAQWEIVRGLADLSQPGSVFVVGDPKQSIYQFRGADVSVFEQVRGVILDAGGQSVALARSFRTHRPLIDGFNHLFGQILVRDAASPVADYQIELGELMQAERQQAPSDEPSLEFLLISKEALSDDDNNTENRRRWEAYEIARRLQEMVNTEKRLVFDKQQQVHRPIGYGDMAILFQSTSNITIYEDAFKALGLPFVTVAGRGYYSRQEVWDLLNLLTALHNPADNLALATALRSPLFALSDDALLALRLVRDENNQHIGLWEALDAAPTAQMPDDEIERVQFARDCLYGLRTLAGRVTIANLLREILDQTGYLAVLTGLPDGARRRGNVEKLIEKAETSGQVTLGMFARSLRDLSAREVREGEALVDVKDAVTLMTVHASKGLEYPLVVLVDASWTRGVHNSNAVMIDPQNGLSCKVYDPVEDKLVSGFAHSQAESLQDLRESAERKRLLYVAATRAQDYLLVTGQMPAIGKDGLFKGGSWKTTTWLGWLWDALAFDEQTFELSTTILDHYAWGRVSVTVPDQVPSDDAFMPADTAERTIWEQSVVQRGDMLPGDTQAPALLADVIVARDAVARHLTATQIADLGAAKVVTNPPFYRQRFRRDIMHDAPAVIEMVSKPNREDVSRRIIGEIVHKMLRWWRFPTEEDDLKNVLESYAWEQGVVHPGQRAYAVQEAQALLRRMKNSDIYRQIESAQKIYREIPFVYRTDKRIIHGILDVLYQLPDGSWAVLDYKTSYVEGYYATKDGQLVDEHARRYHLQVGVYAAAVREQLGDVTPAVYIHYIRYGYTAHVPAPAWQAALEQLETTIGDLLTD